MAVNDQQFFDAVTSGAHPDFIYQSRQSLVGNADGTAEFIVMVGYSVGNQRKDNRFGIAALAGYLTGQVVRIKRIGIQRKMRTMLFDRADWQQGHVHFLEPIFRFRPGELS